jgi:hypothetical protein
MLRSIFAQFRRCQFDDLEVPYRAAFSSLRPFYAASVIRNHDRTSDPLTAAPRASTRALKQRYSFSKSEDTIYALSTAAGRAAIAVIRISGPSCVDVSSTAMSMLRLDLSDCVV